MAANGKLDSCIGAHPTLAVSYLEGRAFHPRGYREGWVRAGHRGLDEPIEVVVGVRRIVMKQHEPAHFGQTCKLERLSNRAVPPANTVGVFRVGVLAIVDQQVGPTRQSET